MYIEIIFNMCIIIYIKAFINSYLEITLYI